MGFFWPAYARIRTESSIVSLYRNIRSEKTRIHAYITQYSATNLFDKLKENLNRALTEINWNVAPRGWINRGVYMIMTSIYQRVFFTKIFTVFYGSQALIIFAKSLIISDQIPRMHVKQDFLKINPSCPVHLKVH